MMAHTGKAGSFAQNAFPQKGRGGDGGALGRGGALGGGCGGVGHNGWYKEPYGLYS